ncbi:DUF3592 domain-containing protein [Streptomyces sp. Isolate_45]|uniref:DUF3592 domain-containing protein n=1 Tax=Streptomyces sp. Isolate_45 TaxID=2950111 RepID=UPI002481F06A|nr:DUF3592 domain-containing protein [Streptomyces sp. Isolate_45]MDA5283916.1 DUF3592 domain-containing protein [Streptomyces sp. Isolate_45]
MSKIPYLVLAVGALVTAVCLLRRRTVLHGRGVAVTARCSAVRRPAHGGEARITLRYPAPDGRTRTHEAGQRECPPGTREGDPVEVLYDPRDPSRAGTALTARKSPWRHYDLYALMGVSLGIAVAAAARI